MNTHSILLSGGRIKAASLPVGALSQDPAVSVAQILRGENHDVYLAHFPKIGGALRQSIDRQPLRPFISTHQGMPGNFYPFIVDDSGVQRYSFSGSDFASIPETRYNIPSTLAQSFQDALNQRDFSQAFQIIQGIENPGRADSKGHSPFFICRPASTDTLVSVSPDILPKIENAVQKILQELLQKCKLAGRNYGHEYRDDELEKLIESILYMQVDVTISRIGEIRIEGIQLPDVGFFLTQLPDIGSLHTIKRINSALRDAVVDRISHITRDKGMDVCFLTSSSVIHGGEDVLEQGDISVLEQSLRERNIIVTKDSVEDFVFSPDTLYLLMNFPYTDGITDKLLSLARKYPDNFSPNPILQIANRGFTDFDAVTITGKNPLDMLRGMTFHNEQKVGEEISFQNMERYFLELRFDTFPKIITLTRADGSILYVYTLSIYSLRKIKGFLENASSVVITAHPYQDGESRIVKDNFDILHSYRFMYAKNIF